MASDWNPLKHYSNVFETYNRPQVDSSDPWQFKNFSSLKAITREGRVGVSTSLHDAEFAGIPSAGFSNRDRRFTPARIVGTTVFTARGWTLPSHTRIDAAKRAPANCRANALEQP